MNILENTSTYYKLQFDKRHISKYVCKKCYHKKHKTTEKLNHFPNFKKLKHIELHLKDKHKIQ